MPRLQLLQSFTAAGGYRPVTTIAGPDARPDVLYRGQNLWIRPGGRIVPIKGVGTPLNALTVTNATNAAPIVISTSAAHNLATGDQVAVSGVLGNTAANGSWTITVLTSTTFSLTSTTGTGAYTSGGTVTVNLGARIFALDQYRGEMQGALINNRPPKASLVRYNQSALFFVSENINQQIYVNESITSPYVMTGVTTSATAGKLRVAVMSGATFTVYDAGLSAPNVTAGNTTAEAGGGKSMDGVVSIVQCARRITTDTTSNPSNPIVKTLAASGSNRIRVVLDTAVSGQDGWLFGGTTWGQGNAGPWRVIREVRITPTGTFALSPGSPVVSGTDTRFLRDLRPGDKVRLNSTDYVIATVTGDVDATLTTNFSGAMDGYIGTMKEVALDWRNGELGELIAFDNDIPPLLDGILLFNNVPFGWKDNVLYPSKIGNPESYPAALARGTQSGGNIVGALAGDARIYLLTTNGLEVVTFTQNPDEPFLIRQAWGFGFSAQNQAVVVDGTLYAAVGTATGVKIIRTRVDDSPDLEFSADVESDMKGWKAAQVHVTHDPANGAVLAMYWVMSPFAPQTTVLPFLLQQGIWSLPHLIEGQVVDATVVNNYCEMMILISTHYTTYRFENGDGSTTSAYASWPWVDEPVDGLRKTIKRAKFTGKANTLYLYAGLPGAEIPDVTVSGGASAAFTLASITGHHTQFQTSIPNAQSYSVRVDSTGATASFSQVDVWGLLNPISR